MPEHDLLGYFAWAPFSRREQRSWLCRLKYTEEPE